MVMRKTTVPSQNFTDNNIERKKFIQRYWQYYKMLENDCHSLAKYISFDSDNYGTYSDEIVRQLLNSVKHHRTDRYSDGNLGNLLLALSALYYLECFKFKKISDENSTNSITIFDVPPDTSRLFYIKNFQTQTNVFGPELYGTH